MPDTHNNNSAPELSRFRKTLYSIMICIILLSMIEGAAWIWLRLAASRIPVGNIATETIGTDWFDFLNDDLVTAGKSTPLYVPDAKLFWRLRPDTNASLENIVYKTKGEPVRWEITINGDGFRGTPYPSDNPSQKPVIATLGDSCTFGFRVSDKETYPAQLQEILRSQAFGNATVVNYGVPGYTSFQGLQLLREILKQRRPDIIVLAFGANDLEADRYSDEEKAEQIGTKRARLAQLLYRLSITKVLTGNLLAQRSIASATSAGTMRVPPEAFERNMRDMVKLSQEAGAKVILLNIALMKEDNGALLARIAQEQGVAWIDGRTILLKGLADMLSGKRFPQERKELDRFWQEQVLQYRYVYYPEEVYRKLLETPYWPNLLLYLMIEPVHPNRLGHRLIAEEIAHQIADR
jgi:lysophospholipase L1-like esterase